MAIFLTAGLLGYRLSATLIAPVTRMSGMVQRLGADDLELRLAPRFAGTELEPIAQAFDRFLRRMAGFVEREKSFTAAASHELRTPLAVIQGAVEIAAGQPDVGDRCRAALERIGRAQREMTESVEALLFLAREEHRLPDPAEGTDVPALLETIVANHVDLAADKPVEVRTHFDGPLKVLAPPSVVGMVAGDLLRNALKYTSAGSIEVTLTGRELTIRDTGPGIPADDLPHLFDRDQLPGRIGAGIGLRLAKTICERYGWQLRLESGVAGTTAHVSF